MLSGNWLYMGDAEGVSGQETWTWLGLAPGDLADTVDEVRSRYGTTAIRPARLVEGGEDRPHA